MSQEPDHPSASPSGQNQYDGEALPLIELETLLNRLPSRRKRLVQIGLVLAAFVVVLVTFWTVIVPKTPPNTPVSVQPTQPPSTFTIISNVNYGTITMNGMPQRGSLPFTFTLRGQSFATVTFDAPPFQPVTCRFPAPNPGTSLPITPCPETGGRLSVQVGQLLALFFTLDDLPPAQQQQIIALIPQIVTAQQDISVPAGSTVVTGLNSDGTVQTRRVSELLRASAFLVPTAQNTQQRLGCFSFVCTELPNINPPDYPGSAHIWQVTTSIVLHWRFTTPGGQVVSDVTFPFDGTTTLFLSYDAATGWHAAPLLSDGGSMSEQLTGLFCSVGEQLLQIEQERSLRGENWEITSLHDAGIEGCELALTQNTTDEGHFLWRFGALLAADTRAHQTLPVLPLATPADEAAVGG